MIKTNARTDKQRLKRKKREGKRKECNKMTEQEQSFLELWPTGGKIWARREIISYILLVTAKSSTEIQLGEKI